MRWVLTIYHLYTRSHLQTAKPFIEVESGWRRPPSGNLVRVCTRQQFVDLG